MSTGARHHEHHVAHVAQGGRFAGLKTQKAFAKRVLSHLSRIRASCRGAFRGARKTHRPRAAFRGARKTHRTPSRYGSTRSRVQGLQARKTHVCRGAFGGVQKTHRLPSRYMVPPGAGSGHIRARKTRSCRGRPEERTGSLRVLVPPGAGFRVYGLEKRMRAGVRLGGPEKRTGSLRVVIPPGAGFTG